MTNGQDSQSSGLEIAVIGMAGRFPGARTPEELWTKLCQGYDAVTRLTDAELRSAGVDERRLRDPRYVKAAVVLDDVDRFDARFFGFTPREAQFMDPQQRLFLECAWAALEDAGYVDETYGGKIGVFASCGPSGYFIENVRHRIADLMSSEAHQIVLGNDKDFLATRTSYELGMTGPSVTVQTACSSSLVATHLACLSLFNFQCDVALAGGVKVIPSQREGYLHQEGGILSPDGYCRPFDASAKGTINGSGVGIVVLKRLDQALQDGDHVYAVIKGSAVNNDGAKKVGFTAPSVDGQSEVIAAALAVAGVGADSISYVEAHGTGTSLGDPIEVAGLTRAFRMSTDRKRFCALGSIKSNLGHLDTAAGVAGLLKTCLALHHRQLPPSVHFERPNPTIDFDGSPFFVNATLRPWPRNGTPRRAGVSAFGIGGTNAHVVLEELTEPAAAAAAPDGVQLFPISARSRASLGRSASNLSGHLRARPELNLADAAYTLQVGRRALPFRTFVVCSSREEAVRALEAERVPVHEAPEDAPRVVFMFPGQGTPYVGMGKGLYDRYPVFRKHLDACLETLAPHLDLELRSVLYAPEDEAARADERLVQTRVTQPALFAVEYALAKLWMSWGIAPAAMIGHSLGEYVAACLAGVMSLPDALRLVATRGRLIQGLPPGAMLSVPLAADRARHIVPDGVDLAAENGPDRCVLSGPEAAIREAERRLAAQSIDTQRLRVSHAFHSSMMDGILGPFRELVRSVALHPPQVPFVSNVTGGWATAEDVTDPEYWVRHLRQPVRFSRGVETAKEKGMSAWLEVGPGSSLGSLAALQLAPGTLVLGSIRHPRSPTSDATFILGTLGRLWSAGARPDWQAIHSVRPRRVSLPTYPFESRRYWLDKAAERPLLAAGAGEAPPEPAADPTEPSGDPSGPHERPQLSTPYVAPRNELENHVAQVWEQLFGIAPIGVDDNFFELGGHSLLATHIVSRLRDLLLVEVPIGKLLAAPTVGGVAAEIVTAMTDGIERGRIEAALEELDAAMADARSDRS